MPAPASWSWELVDLALKHINNKLDLSSLSLIYHDWLLSTQRKLFCTIHPRADSSWVPQLGDGRDKTVPDYEVFIRMLSESSLLDLVENLIITGYKLLREKARMDRVVNEAKWNADWAKEELLPLTEPDLQEGEDHHDGEMWWSDKH
jgi:hypothetical protein